MAVPPPDCVPSTDVTLAAEVGNGVGPALSSALNVMAFTHDLDIGASENHTTGNGRYNIVDLMISI